MKLFKKRRIFGIQQGIQSGGGGISWSSGRNLDYEIGWKHSGCLHCECSQ